MRGRARFRAALVAGATLAVLMLAGTAASAAVWTDQTTYAAGDTVSISGDGMAPGESVGVDVSFPDGSLAQHHDVTADDTGAFSDSFTLAADAPGGDYAIVATGAESGSIYTTSFDPNGNGSLDCPSLTPHNPTHYKLLIGSTVTCTIDGASEVSGESTTPVIIKSSTLGNTTVTGTVTGTGSATQITFTFTAPGPGCDTTIVAYQSNGLNSNNGVITAGGHSAAGFAYVDTNGNVVECGAQASIGITKVPDRKKINPLDPIGFTITVTSGGPGTALDVVMTDPLPVSSGLDWSIDGGSAAGDCTIASGTLTCDLGVMPAGDSETIHITSPTTVDTGMDLDPKGYIYNTATVTTSNAGSAEATALVIIRCPSVKISQTPDSATALVGDTIGFTITVNNQDAGVARGITVADTLPSGKGLSWSIDPASSGGCSISSGALTCTWGNFHFGDSKFVHITSTVSKAGKVTNKATVSGSNTMKPHTAVSSVTVA